MRFNNYRTVKYVPFLYFFLGVSIIVFFILEFQFEKGFFLEKLIFWCFIAILVMLMLYIFLFGKYFEYDSDGETLCITNRGALLSEAVNYREKRAEFPKQKLKSYTFSNYILYKSLKLYVRSGKDRKKIKKVQFNITFVRYHRIKLLKQSLNKVVQQNKG